MRVADETLSLRELIAQLIDAGKAYARAEIAYVKQVATTRATAAAMGVGFAIGALLFVQASLTVLVAALGLWIARWVGPAGGLAIGAVVGLLVAALLGWIGMRRILASGDAR